MTLRITIINLDKNVFGWKQKQKFPRKSKLSSGFSFQSSWLCFSIIQVYCSNHEIHVLCSILAIPSHSKWWHPLIISQLIDDTNVFYLQLFKLQINVDPVAYASIVHLLLWCCWCRCWKLVLIFLLKSNIFYWGICTRCNTDERRKTNIRYYMIFLSSWWNMLQSQTGNFHVITKFFSRNKNACWFDKLLSYKLIMHHFNLLLLWLFRRNLKETMRPTWKGTQS